MHVCHCGLCNSHYRGEEFHIVSLAVGRDHSVRC